MTEIYQKQVGESSKLLPKFAHFSRQLLYRLRLTAAHIKLLKLFTFAQFSALAIAYRVCQTSLGRKVMKNFTGLMQRLLEIQSGERQRSPELIAEDERLIDGLRKRALTLQTVNAGEDGSTRG
jgi:hypothetical protein